MTELKALSDKIGGKFLLSDDLHTKIDDYFMEAHNLPYDFRRKLKISLFRQILRENAPTFPTISV